jgi:outer membrane protein assembly factor BamB
MYSKRFVSLSLGFSAVFFLLSIVPSARSEDWPQWRGPNRNGISTETGWLGAWPATGPKIVWKNQIGTGYSSISISEGRVYTMGNTAKSKRDANQKDVVFCFDAGTGREIWKYPYDCALSAKNYKGGPNATPTVDGKFVYTFSKEGHVHCLDAIGGKEIWARNLQKEEGLKPPTWGYASSATVHGNLLLLNAGAAGVALDKATGKTIWKSAGSGAGYSTPVIAQVNGKEIVGLFVQKHFLGVDAKTGKQILKSPWKTSWDVNSADPIFSENTVFISSGYKSGGTVLKITGNECSEIWRNKEMNNQINSSVVWKGYIYGFDGQAGSGGSLKCLDYQTGKPLWSQKGLGTGSLMLAEGKLICLSNKGKLVIAEATTAGYKPLRQAQILTGTCWTMPVLANGKIYARDAEGTLVCVDAKGA